MTKHAATVPTSLKRYLAIVPLLVALPFGACEGRALAVTTVGTPTASRPKVVRVAVVVRNIIGIDDVQEHWQVTGLLIAKWENRNYRYRPRGRGEFYRELPDNIWKPEFEFTNEELPTSFRFVDLYAQPDGTIVYSQTFSATLSSRLNLRRFPFDSQVLPIVVQASGDDIDRTIIQPDERDSTLSDRPYVGVAQWVPLSLSETVGDIAGSARPAHDIEFGLKVRRNPTSYVLKFFVPLLLLVIISWITFWLSHEEFKTKDQLQSAIATLLIIVAFNITATNVLPRTEYITYIDAVLFTSFVFVVISIATIVVTHLIQPRSQQRALKVRRLAGGILPVLFLITQMTLFFGYHIAG